MRSLSACQSLKEFMAFLKQIRRQARGGLLAIPWTAVWRAEAFHEGNELVEIRLIPPHIFSL